MSLKAYDYELCKQIIRYAKAIHRANKGKTIRFVCAEIPWDDGEEYERRQRKRLERAALLNDKA